MKTSKAFATISYNTDDFLITKLNDLIRSHKIDFWAFINHLAEEDEKKAHKHVLIIPNGQFDTSNLIEYLNEMPKDLTIDENGTCKPLTCIASHKVNSFGDWYYYNLHDAKYLSMKSQSRKYSYDMGDFIVSDNDYFLELIHNIDMTKLFRSQRFFEGLKSGLTVLEMVQQGIVPIQQVSAYMHISSMFYSSNTNRNGHETHTPLDQETEPLKND